MRVAIFTSSAAGQRKVLERNTEKERGEREGETGEENGNMEMREFFIWIRVTRSLLQTLLSPDAVHTQLLQSKFPISKVILPLRLYSFSSISYYYSLCFVHVYGSSRYDSAICLISLNIFVRIYRILLCTPTNSRATGV